MVADTKSISKAAEELFMGQPNLSRAIKELENTLGINIFNRNPRGITTTPDGEEFLRYARKIVAMVDELERLYINGEARKLRFSVSVPRTSYIAFAFARFSESLEKNASAIEIKYKETNPIETITSIMNDECSIGIIRYRSLFDKYFQTLFEERKLVNRTICEVPYVLAVSKDSPLAHKEHISCEDLSNLVEICHSDPYAPLVSQIDVKKAEISPCVDKRIYVMERASQYEILETNINTFKWITPTAPDILERHNLIQKRCCDAQSCKDVLIYKKEYKLNNLDKAFIDEVFKAKADFVDAFFED
jgi:DNA-binding transcriptional LysR family regulator